MALHSDIDVASLAGHELFHLLVRRKRISVREAEEESVAQDFGYDAARAYHMAERARQAELWPHYLAQISEIASGLRDAR